jgi:hypothetical protein
MGGRRPLSDHDTAWSASHKQKLEKSEVKHQKFKLARELVSRLNCEIKTILKKDLRKGFSQVKKSLREWVDVRRSRGCLFFMFYFFFLNKNIKGLK